MKGYRQPRRKTAAQQVKERDAFIQTLLRTLAAILIDRDAPIAITATAFMLAAGLRVNADVAPDGSQVLTLQDKEGRTLEMGQEARA